MGLKGIGGPIRGFPKTKTSIPIPIFPNRWQLLHPVAMIHLRSPKQIHPKQNPKQKCRQNWPPLANMVVKITTPSNILKKTYPQEKLDPKSQAKTIQLYVPKLTPNIS